MTETSVNVTAETPVVVTTPGAGVLGGSPAAVVGANRYQDQVLDPSIAARTTFQEDLTFAGQRRVNLIWEYTQSVIAIVVVLTTMSVGAFQAIAGGADARMPSIISVAFGMITGFYFSRTNHSAIGGIGRKPMAPYEGR